MQQLIWPLHIGQKNTQIFQRLMLQPFHAYLNAAKKTVSGQRIQTKPHFSFSAYLSLIAAFQLGTYS